MLETTKQQNNTKKRQGIKGRTKACHTAHGYNLNIEKNQS